MSEVLEGGCLCGAVRFRARAPALRTLVCHCRFCQKMTGSTSYAESMFPMDSVELSGPLSVHEHVSQTSGKAVHVHFCPRCGTTVSLTFQRWPEYRAISRGTFDDPDRVCIGSHIWTESAQTGVILPADTDCFERARATLDGTPIEPTRYPAPVAARSAA
ncbi:MAG: GFA family protein [Burkholderiaceae bacterium]|nr:GFA family protein [Burkholderiaceae bacterium]